MARFCDLPNEVSEEIMLQLPPESLKRLKRVCKTWYAHINALINDPRFVDKHLRKMKNDLLSSPRLLLRDLFTFNIYSECMYLLAIADCDYSLNCRIHGTGERLTQSVAHCNGIICAPQVNGNAFLLNPALRELKIVRKSSAREGYRVNGMALGFDSKANDYKVVTFFRNRDRYNGEKGAYKAELYSLSTDSSKEIKLDAEIIDDRIFGFQSVYCNGVCYWYCYHQLIGTIVSFDVGEEIFRRVPFPNNALTENRSGDQIESPTKIAVWNESIALFSYHQMEPLLIDMWVMDAFFGGVKGSCSWARHLTIGPLVGIHQPLAFWGNEELFMETKDHKLISYHLHKQELNDHSICSEHFCGHLVDYSKSLVSVLKRKTMGEAQPGAETNSS